MKMQIRNLKKAFQDKLILNIEKLDLLENKTYCIRGRNGTGKTTFMQIIANLLNYDEGQVLYDGKVVNDEIMKQMTYVPPNPYIFNTTVYKNIYYPLRLRNDQENEIETVINQYLDYFDISHLKNQHATKCSSGEKMKTALIRGLIFKPKLLLLDEPTTNLDVESIEKLKNKLLEIKKDTTILFISHDISFIQSISDREYFLNDTKLELGD